MQCPGSARIHNFLVLSIRILPLFNQNLEISFLNVSKSEQILHNYRRHTTLVRFKKTEDFHLCVFI